MPSIFGPPWGGTVQVMARDREEGQAKGEILSSGRLSFLIYGGNGLSIAGRVVDLFGGMRKIAACFIKKYLSFYGPGVFTEGSVRSH